MASAVEVLVLLLTFGGLVYSALSLLGARAFARATGRRRRPEGSSFTPDVTLLKPLKGAEPGLYEALASHCRQVYAGQVQIVCGVTDIRDPAVAVVARLRSDFPDADLQVVECPERLGTSGKVSNLVQMSRVARTPFVLVNDSDIRVEPGYLAAVMAAFEDGKVGMVTAPYRGRTAPAATVWSKLEALGIATDFMPGVLTARMLEGGIRFGLGSTLAMRRSALTEAGGFEAVIECLADDYELGARIARAGHRVELCAEVVETSVPAYIFSAFFDHQLRWARSTRDSRRWGYLGLGVTYCLPWALALCVASGFALWSFSLLSVVVLVRVSVALSVGVGLLRDGQVLRDIWLLPVRDCFGLFFWLWSYAGDTVLWRGERFRLRDGRISKISGESAAS